MRYSKRELKGLPTPIETIVDSLSNYIKLFSTGIYEYCYFRGEATNYHSTTSSALRKHDGSFGSPSFEFPFPKMLYEFKREVWHKTIQDERSNFLAFAQHHGLPTNLIDFTSNPLVALYFACQPYKNSNGNSYDEEHGFIYVLENRFIDITKVIEQHEAENLLEKYISDDYSVFIALYELFCQYERENPCEFYCHFKKLNEEWHHSIASPKCRLERGSLCLKKISHHIVKVISQKFVLIR